MPHGVTKRGAEALGDVAPEAAPGTGDSRPGLRAVAEAQGEYDVHAVEEELRREMMEAAAALEFERAAILRDQIYELKHAENPFRGTHQPNPRSSKKHPKAHSSTSKKLPWLRRAPTAGKKKKKK